MNCDDLQKELDAVKERIQSLEDNNKMLSTAIAMIAEMWRRMDYELQSGEAPDRGRVGRFSFVLDSDSPHCFPVKLVLTKLTDYTLRLDFLEEIGVNE